MIFLDTNPSFTKSNNNLTATRSAANGVWQHEKIGPLIAQNTGVHTIDLIINSDLRALVGIIRDDEGAGGVGYIGSHPASYGKDSDYTYKYNSGAYSNYGGKYTTGDTITIVYDSDNSTLEFKLNGVSWGIAFNAVLAGDYYFGVSCYNTGWGASILVPGQEIVNLESSQIIGQYSVVDLLSQQIILINPYLYYQQIQKISCHLAQQHSQLLGMAPRLYHQITQILAQARRLNLTHDQVIDTTTPIHLQHDQVFNNLAQVALLTTQVMRNYGAPVALEMLQTWAAYDYNLVYLPMVQLIGAQLDAVLQEIQFSVMVAASPVGVVDCDFDRKGFCNVATLLLRSRSEWGNKLVGDPVVLTVLGEQYQMIVTNKPQDEQITQDTYEVGYLLECASVTCQLAEGLNPDLAASRVSGTFPAGTMLTEILDFLTDGVCNYNLAVPDFSTGGYDFDDTERMTALREVLPEQYGWIIETDQAGVLQLRQWRKPEIGGAGQKTLTMSRKSLTPPSDTVYTQVIVRNYNQEDGTSGLVLEVVDNGDGTGIIYGYSVPWTEYFSVFDSEDSSAPSLLITGGAVEEVEVEDTDVEFVDFAASLSKPCYSDPVIDWGNNDSLSPVTYTESGTLTTATEPGYSVAVKFTYTTKRKRWDFDNRKIDVSQVRLRYD